MLDVGRRTRVAILDDHRVVRDHLAEVFQAAGLEVVAVSEDPLAFAEVAGQADVAVAGLKLEEAHSGTLLDGVGVLRWLRSCAPGLRVLVFAAGASAEQVRRCYREGAAGYLSKASAGRTELVEAVRQAARGEQQAPPPAAGPDPAREQEERSRAALQRLTPREREVLAHVAAGYDNLKIAALLNVTEHTVKAHMVAIYRKVRPENRVELALLARNMGLGPLAH